jgi:hypothetical protein
MPQTQTQTPPAQAVPLMQTPPQVITVKDCSYLKDMLSWELLAMKKCSHLAKECSDADIRTKIDRAGQMHLRHYNLLLKHLQNDNNAAMAQIPRTGQ